MRIDAAPKSASVTLIGITIYLGFEVYWFSVNWIFDDA
jgi:hypothetical protein